MRIYPVNKMKMTNSYNYVLKRNIAHAIIIKNDVIPSHRSYEYSWWLSVSWKKTKNTFKMTKNMVYDNGLADN